MKLRMVWLALGAVALAQTPQFLIKNPGNGPEVCNFANAADKKEHKLTCSRISSPKMSELEDVPAIGVERLTPTCIDKTRILLHDEQDPPKYWCHQVRTR